MTALNEIRKGDIVRVWFDTGAMGVTILYGVVIGAGPKALRVRWESGLTNRIRRDEPKGVTPAAPEEVAELRPDVRDRLR